VSERVGDMVGDAGVGPASPPARGPIHCGLRLTVSPEVYRVATTECLLVADTPREQSALCVRRPTSQLCETRKCFEFYVPSSSAAAGTWEPGASLGSGSQFSSLKSKNPKPEITQFTSRGTGHCTCTHRSQTQSHRHHTGEWDCLRVSGWSDADE